VGWECGRSFEGISIFIIETSTAGTKNDGSNKGSGSTSHVDNTGSGKIDHTDIAEGIFFGKEGAEESIAAPDTVHNHGVDESSKEDRVAQVGLHLATLGDSSSDNGGCSGSEGELEEPRVVILEVNEEKVGVSNKGLAGFRVSSVGKGETNGEEANGSTTGIQQVLKHNILHILLADRSSTEHSESSLHEEDKGSL